MGMAERETRGKPARNWHSGHVRFVSHLTRPRARPKTGPSPRGILDGDALWRAVHGYRPPCRTAMPGPPPPLDRGPAPRDQPPRAAGPHLCGSAPPRPGSQRVDVQACIIETDHNIRYGFALDRGRFETTQSPQNIPPNGHEETSANSTEACTARCGEESGRIGLRTQHHFVRRRFQYPANEKGWCIDRSGGDGSTRQGSPPGQVRGCWPEFC